MTIAFFIVAVFMVPLVSYFTVKWGMAGYYRAKERQSKKEKSTKSKIPYESKE